MPATPSPRVRHERFGAQQLASAGREGKAAPASERTADVWRPLGEAGALDVDASYSAGRYCRRFALSPSAATQIAEIMRTVKPAARKVVSGRRNYASPARSTDLSGRNRAGAGRMLLLVRAPPPLSREQRRSRCGSGCERPTVQGHTRIANDSRPDFPLRPRAWATRPLPANSHRRLRCGGAFCSCRFWTPRRPRTTAY